MSIIHTKGFPSKEKQAVVPEFCTSFAEFGKSVYEPIVLEILNTLPFKGRA